MRKFNVDELIWFIIQLMLIFLMCFLVTSGNITNFVNDNMIIYFYLSIGILVLFSFVQIGKIFSIRGRRDITNKFLPLTLILLLSIVFLFILPAYRGLRLNSINDELSFSNPDTLIINNDNYSILYEIDSGNEKYKDKNIEFVGKVYDSNYKTGQLILTREVVSCCQSDKSIIKIKTLGITDKIQKDTWLKVVGKIKYIDGWYIEIIEYKPTYEPEDVYFHEKL